MKLLRIFCLALVAFSFCAWHPAAAQVAEQVLVIGRSSDQVAALVHSTNGSVERDLSIINGVVARLSPQQIGYLRAQGLQVAPNTHLNSAATLTADSLAPSTKAKGVDPAGALSLDQVRPRGLSGRGVTVAVVDSGLSLPGLDRGVRDDTFTVQDRHDRFLVYRDFTGPTRRSQDAYGHGTHIAGTIAGALPSDQPNPLHWRGVAPEANLVVARALGADGGGTYADTIAAIDWIVRNKDRYKIRVLNLSLLGPVESLYWADPLNQAVMQAWKAGIVVVTAAGNNGPAAESVAVPGNNPYVVTVGAYRSAAVSESGQDELTDWSARGPTPDSGFTKPDVLAPGVRVISALPPRSELAGSMAGGLVQKQAQLDFVGLRMPVGLYQLSGTSMAAAETSGLVALLLQQRPDLTNDQVKWLLSRTAHVAVDKRTGQAAYSTWEQGFGRLDAVALLGYRGDVGSANRRMNIARDLDTSANGQHYVGMTAYNAATGLYSAPASGDSKGTYFNWCGQFVPWPGSSSLGSCGTPGGTTAPGAGSVWSGHGSVWSGHGSVWSGAGTVWSGAGSVWSGHGSVWSGAGSVWSGHGSVWSGHGSVWSGHGSVWSGHGSVWSGHGSVWSGVVVFTDGRQAMIH
jgi:serine protease AprX